MLRHAAFDRLEMELPEKGGKRRSSTVRARGRDGRILLPPFRPFIYESNSNLKWPDAWPGSTMHMGHKLLEKSDRAWSTIF